MALRSSGPLVALFACGALLALTACGATVDDPAADAAEPEPVESVLTPSQPGADPCATEFLTVVNPGQLTVAAVPPLDEPMFVDGEPDSGEGFASALVFAVADELGFRRTQVSWIEATSLDAGQGTADAAPERVPALGKDGVRADFAVGAISAPVPPGIELSVAYLVGPGDDQLSALAFIEGNPLRTCVDRALVDLTTDGELAALASTWLTDTPWEEALVGATPAGVS